MLKKGNDIFKPPIENGALWSRGRLEKLIITQLVRTYTAFYGTRWFIIVLRV